VFRTSAPATSSWLSSTSPVPYIRFNPKTQNKGRKDDLLRKEKKRGEGKEKNERGDLPTHRARL